MRSPHGLVTPHLINWSLALLTYHRVVISQEKKLEDLIISQWQTPLVWDKNFLCLNHCSQGVTLPRCYCGLSLLQFALACYSLLPIGSQPWNLDWRTPVVGVRIYVVHAPFSHVRYSTPNFRFILLFTWISSTQPECWKQHQRRQPQRSPRQPGQ